MLALMTALSVVVATYNRAHLLQGTLEALAAQDVPDSLRWEIVVVDNNSQDTTGQVVAAFRAAARIPVRYVFEPDQGLSRARNRGITEATGAIIAFTDDDVLAAPDWIAQIAAALDRWRAHGVGGRILPRWEATPPRWLTESRPLLDRLAIMDVDVGGLLARPLMGRARVWGANMAFRRELFETVGAFDPRLGLVGRKLARGEETDLVDRALDHGLTIAYDPAPTVFHRIGQDRMRKAYFRRLAFDHAEAETRRMPPAAGRLLLGAPLWAYRTMLADLWRWVRPAEDRQSADFDLQLAWLSSVGRLVGCWKEGLLRRPR
jgi:glycosyltransferase involved in cell wall biosynthesis